MNSINFSPPPALIISPLDVLEAVSIDKEYDTRGHAPLKVLCRDGHLYVVKSAGPHVPPCVLISEFLGHFLLRLWGLPTPSAAIINLPADYLMLYKRSVPGKISNRHQPYHYNRPCFGSRIIPNAIEVGPLHQTRRNDEWRKTVNFYDLMLLTLFDIWIENDDRKPSNPNLLLRPIAKSKYRWVAIDHAFCFSTLDFDQLDPSFISVSYNDSLLNAPMMAGLKRLVHRVPGWSTAISAAFYLRIQACQQAFQIISNLVPTELAFSQPLQTNVSDFLFDKARNRDVLAEYFSRF